MINKLINYQPTFCIYIIHLNSIQICKRLLVQSASKTCVILAFLWRVKSGGLDRCHGTKRAGVRSSVFTACSPFSAPGESGQVCMREGCWAAGDV